MALVIATCAAAALAIAVVGSRWQLVAFAAPLLGVLTSVMWQIPSQRVRGFAEPRTVRCFENEEVELAVVVEPVGAPTALTVTPLPIGGMTADSTQKTLRLSAERWGRYLVPVRVEAMAPNGLLVGSATLTVGEVHVYPLAAPQATPIPRTELPDRIGTHLTRRIGPGVEYADIREYVPGDQLRTVNWPVSARRGRLHVTERMTDRAADVVVLIDTYPQAPGPATDAVERSVRGATQIVQSALQRGDRAGIVGLGRSPRWLGPDIGRRQFYRVLDTVLCVGDEFATTTGTLAPRAALPAGAIVIAFTTLLDTEFALSLIDLRRRGHTVVAVDILRGAPFQDELAPAIRRMWRLERKAMYRDMGTIGVDVVAWHEDITLEMAMRLIPDHSGRRRSRR
ncbi:DUF58 domain-containing protein [Antrihabitans sp. YC2-6]|uniref:DUF58 domain-containing protein n=1 Tax=Antrihabitans sp. YC2-6 TaxID=2799498 RepID=UPI0018F7167C|nr:DUF58 domain-containing protein [Antrihabitans sp. YC2-6]MBJ8345905.1 DUF58 domain-containing protein [Antrihabitans sp. YC2-6]